MELARILVQALLVVAAMTVLDRVNSEQHLPGIDAVLSVVRWGAFVPFAASVAASVHQYRAAIIAILATTLLLGWPTSTVELATQVTTVGAGVVMGEITGKLLRDGR